MSNDQLTPRERDILLLAAEGLADKQIADRLGIARGTVTTHWKRMRERTGAINRAQAIAFEMARAYRTTAHELTQTAGLFQGLVAALEDFAVFLLDADRVVKSWNPGVGKLLGYSEAEWMGQSADVIFTPEQQAQKVPLQELETARHEGRALDDRWHVRKDGSLFWASGVMVPIRGNDGEVVCFSKILRDLTQLKRLEAAVVALGGDPERA